MKLKEYQRLLNELIKEHPEILEFDVIEEIDNGCGGTCKVPYAGRLGFIDADDDFAECYDDNSDKANVFCVN